MTDALAVAHAEIDRREVRWQRHQPSKRSRYMLAVLADARGTLNRHTPDRLLGELVCTRCRYSWPCPDAAPVLRLYAPGVAT